MSIMNETQALKQVRKFIRRHGATGTTDQHFVDNFFTRLGRRPGCNETAILCAGVRAGEQRGEFYVTRDELGSIVMVDKFDCSKAEVVAELEPPCKPEIGAYELTMVMRETLEKKCNSDGVIITIGQNEPALIRSLHKEISQQYSVTHKKINQVFDAMFVIGLRGDARRLRLTGMPLPDIPDLSSTPGVARLTHEHDQAMAHADDLQGKLDAQLQRNEYLQTRLGEISSELKLLKVEQPGILEENSTLTEENERLIQANNDLRTQNQRLFNLERAVQSAVTKYNEST